MIKEITPDQDLMERMRLIASNLKLLEQIKSAYPDAGKYAESYIFINGISEGIRLTVETIVEGKDPHFNRILKQVKQMVNLENTNYSLMLNEVNQERH